MKLEFPANFKMRKSQNKKIKLICDPELKNTTRKHCLQEKEEAVAFVSEQ